MSKYTLMSFLFYFILNLIKEFFLIEKKNTKFTFKLLNYLSSSIHRRNGTPPKSSSVKIQEGVLTMEGEMGIGADVEWYTAKQHSINHWSDDSDLKY